MKLLIGLLVSTAITIPLIPCEANGEPQNDTKKPMVALMLVDVTRSLDQQEVDEVADMAASAVRSLVPRTQMAVYPIQKDTENPEQIIGGTISEKAKTRDALGRVAKPLLRSKMAHLRKNFKNLPKIDARTCIMDEFVFAGNYFQQRELVNHRKVLVIFSDMIEDCSLTPLQRGIHLTKPGLHDEIEALKRMKPVPGLAGVEIIFVLPPASHSGHNPATRPRLDDLEAFWREFVARAGTGLPEKPTFEWRRGVLPPWLNRGTALTVAAP